MKYYINQYDGLITRFSYDLIISRKWSPILLNSDNNNRSEMALLTFTSLVVAVVDKPFVTFVLITFEGSILVAVSAVRSAGCNIYHKNTTLLYLLQAS